MNGSWDVQQALVASRQANLRYEADTTRLATDATLAAAEERTRHSEAADANTHGHMVGAPRAIAATQATKPAVQSPIATSKSSPCDGSAVCTESTLAA